MKADAKRFCVTGRVLWLLVLTWALALVGAEASDKVSMPIGAVLREPLPAEDLRLSTNATEWVITGPTFTYRVRKATGAISELRVVREGQEVIATSSPVDIRLDDYRLSSDLASGSTEVVTAGKDKVVLRAHGLLRDPAKRKPEVDCTLLQTFFSDGVVVSTVRLTPRKDLSVEKALLVQVHAQGEFSHYLHKRRDENGDDAVRGSLPETGNATRFSTLTSCLQVFSPSAALALFTDCGATHLSRTNLETAEIEVTGRERKRTGVSLCQYLVHVGPGDAPYVLKEGEEFSFRVGMSLAPNRIAPRRMHDLRMFAWIGDPKYPYATDQEIEEVARCGYTIFQMHRLGTPGGPRPPAGELERVIKKVHEMGMLFLWAENADLMYDSAPGVQEMKAAGRWPQWQGFNYGGRYQATMDPYCNLAATCLASPNGLASYRLDTIRRMLERFDVDGIYLDDNLAYANCTLWREHGHPRPVYDCLIELHEVNWQRRQLLLSKCPHSVLVSHNTRAIILPVVSDFDAIVYGEGYSFGTMENYRDYYRPVNGLPAQGMIWPGGQDRVRCAAAVAYNYDLLTGGGQYCYIDWRLFPKKFSYAAGVTDTEHVFMQTYNLAQYYFGLYESTPYYFGDSAALFATSTPSTYATIYHNQVWNDWLIPIANMKGEPQQTSLQIRAPEVLGLKAQDDYLLFDTNLRTAKRLRGAALNEALSALAVPAESLRLLYLRQLPSEGAYHVWGGKRLSEVWDRQGRKLTLTLQGPAGLQDSLFLGCSGQTIAQVLVGGAREPFSFDPVQGLAHGKVTFTSKPLKLEVLCSARAGDRLPEGTVPVGPLGRLLSPGYAPLWQKQRPNITDLALIYQGGEQRPQWTTERYAPYVSARDAKNGREQWLFDGFLLIEFANGKHGVFEPSPRGKPARKADWLALLERNFATNDGVPNLEKVCEDVAERIGPPLRRRQVILTLPEAIAGQTNWGELDGKALDFRRAADRLQATEWYLDAALQRWKLLAPRQLDLAGFYWVSESFPRSTNFIPAVAGLVHARHYQFFWIPYWHLGQAKGKQANWRVLGFDTAWQQPNHFFDPEVPDRRLEEACALAHSNGMGLEMEFDGRMIDRPQDFERRFDAYLDAFTAQGVKDTASIAYYEGGGALFRLANSVDPQMRAHYDRIAQFILDRQRQADGLFRVAAR